MIGPSHDGDGVLTVVIIGVTITSIIAFIVVTIVVRYLRKNQLINSTESEALGEQRMV